MSVRSRSSRFVLWAAMCALLLKAAVPMLASAAATWQGKPVGEVCNVYGVVLPDPHAQHHHHHHDGGHDPQALAHHGDHCALSGLAALATPPSPHTVAPLPDSRAAPPDPPVALTAAPDECARWAMRLKHGPPQLA